jgi:hypothetical protein
MRTDVLERDLQLPDGWLAANCPTATLRLREGVSHFTIVEHAEPGLDRLAEVIR